MSALKQSLTLVALLASGAVVTALPVALLYATAQCDKADNAAFAAKVNAAKWAYQGVVISQPVSHPKFVNPYN